MSKFESLGLGCFNLLGKQTKSIVLCFLPPTLWGELEHPSFVEPLHGLGMDSYWIDHTEIISNKLQGFFRAA